MKTKYFERTASPVLFACFVFLIVFWGFSKLEEAQKTKNAKILLEKAAYEQLVNFKIEMKATDLYGGDIKFQKKEAEDYVEVSAESAGSDRAWGTQDDIVCVKRDYNKSKIVGKWISKKSKEFIKGVISGIKE